MTNQAQLIEIARSYIGTPFRHQGRLPGTALDCAGLIVCSALAAGLNAKDVRGYSREPDGSSLQSTIESQMIRVYKWMPGDLLLMRYYRDPRHVALWTGTGIIHANNVDKKVVEHGMDSRMQCQVVSAFRFKEFC